MKLELTGGKFLEHQEYRAIGFKCGLEIHQQLDTRKKLFCHCPVGLVHKDPDAMILRHMRPTLSELGEYDGTALMEFKTRKEVIYQLYRDNTCTYEMDDTPPFPINQEAVDIAIEIALLFNCSVVDEVHIVRKQYLDGSIPTGFQRTAVIGLDGWIPYKDRRIGIRMLTLEEDACREVSDIGHTITFTTDRLSTPLVEVITYPDIQSPGEVEEVNWLLAEVLRVSGKVRRGIGTVRQDVNVSIEGGTRVEIKGVSKIGFHAALTHNEALRQKALLLIKEKLLNSGYRTREDFKFRRTDVTSKADWGIIIPTLPAGEYRVMALSVKGVGDIINYPLQPGTDVASEISGRVRVVACLDRMPNIVHSKAVAHSNFVPMDIWNNLRDGLGAEGEDTLFLVWGNRQDTETALGEIEDRILALTRGVPNETRQSLGNGVTDFERILPGPDRMYPDTDSSPTRLTGKRIEELKANLPPSPAVVRDFCRSRGIGENIIKNMLRSGLGTLFYSISKTTRIHPKKIAVFLTEKLRQLRREGYNVDSDGNKWIKGLFSALNTDGNTNISKLMTAAREFLSGHCSSINEAADGIVSVTASAKDVENQIQSILLNQDVLKINDKTRKVRAVVSCLKTKYGSGLNLEAAAVLAAKFIQQK